MIDFFPILHLVYSAMRLSFFFFLILIFFMLPFQSDYINKIREKIRTLFPKAPGNKNDFTYILIHLVSLSGVELFTLRNGYFMYFVHYKHTHTYIFTCLCTCYYSYRYE